jgi:hypothetical protein
MRVKRTRCCRTPHTNDGVFGKRTETGGVFVEGGGGG